MKNILVIVDLQNGFIRYDQTKDIAKKIINLLNNKIFDVTIATRFINHNDSQYIKFLNWHRLLDSPDIDLVDALKVDKIIDKYIYTCVDDSFIDLLKELNEGIIPNHIFICGIDTDCCVLKIATDLFEKGIMPIVLTSYCASNGGEESHRAGIKVMSRLIGKKALIDNEITSIDNLNRIIKERKYRF